MATITKRGNNYRIKVSCGYNINGKQIIKSMTWAPEDGMKEKQIEKELNRQAVIFEEKCKQGNYIDGNIKFKDFAEVWINEYAEKNLKAKTVYRYKILLERIYMAIGHIRLNKLQPVHLMSFYSNLAETGIRKDTHYIAIKDLNLELKQLGLTKTYISKISNISVATLNEAAKGNKVYKQSAEKISSSLNYKLNDLFKADTSKSTLSPQTIRHHHRLISAILQTAVEWQIIPTNPCTKLKPPSAPRKESRYLQDFEVIKLFEMLNDEPLQYKTAITVFIYTGMRRGELCGLKWNDINFADKTIEIKREILYLPSKGLFEDTPKTENSSRIIKVADIAFKLLSELKKSQNENRLKCGDQWQNGNYVFTQWNGRPMHPDSITSWFRNFVKRSHLPYVSIHSLRHTNASLFIANGINITTVSKRLGHSSTAVTTQIYAHAIKSADETASDTLQDLLQIKTK